MIIKGYVLKFDKPQELYEGFSEVISKSALDNTNLDDVVFRESVNGHVLARVKNKTIRLIKDDIGLFAIVNIKNYVPPASAILVDSELSNDEYKFGYSFIQDSEIVSVAPNLVTVTAIKKILEITFY